ncbi:MAG TPA: response regulator [Bryobacteraceae bacterium]
MQRVIQIAVAEDNEADITLVREALNEAAVQCNLHILRDGKEAIEFINSIDRDSKGGPLDLILVDMHLPKYDGEAILERLRSTERHAQTPVVVMTGSDATCEREKAEKHAALCYFRKPSNFDGFMQLGVIVSDILAGKKSMDAEVLLATGESAS